MEISEQELKEKLEQAKKEGRSELEKSITEGTTWRNLDALKDSALNADRKISELGEGRKQMERERDEARREIETLKKATAKPSEPPPEPQKKEERKESARDILATMTPDEEKVLDDMCEQTPALKKAVATGGEKAMAEALLRLRESMPKETAKNLFASYRSSQKSISPEDVQTLLDKALEARKGKQRGPVIPGAQPAQKPAGAEEEEFRPIRTGGGMLELAARDQRGKLLTEM